MDKVVVQLTSPKTMKLLLELEELHLLKVLKSSRSGNKKLSEKYAGKLPIEIGKDLDKYVEQSRNEWENSI